MVTEKKAEEIRQNRGKDT